MNKELIQKIISRKEYSQLPMKDVELAFEKFDKEKYSDEEKVKFTRKLLREVFSSFTSKKLLSLKNKDAEWILKKHLSTRERFSHYEEIYERVLQGFDKNLTIIDLGAGVNGFSYKFFEGEGVSPNSRLRSVIDKTNLSLVKSLATRPKIRYVAIEAIGQLVELMNDYFRREKIKGKAIHLSLFELEKVKKEIKKTKSPRVIFLFKIIDSLEMLERDYSKKLISEIGGLVDKVVVSFATRSMGKGIRFRANRNWFVDFIKKNFKMIDDFELGGERYLVFRKE